MKTKLLSVLSLVAFAASVQATPVALDLTSIGSSGFINGAEFIQGTINPTGTGAYEPFLRLQNNGVEQGFNTSANGVLDNKAGIWTRNLLAATIPTITVNGNKYREIRLDINENNNRTGRYLSLDSLEIYLEDVAGISTKSGLTNLKYSRMALDTITSSSWTTPWRVAVAGMTCLYCCQKKSSPTR